MADTEKTPSVLVENMKSLAQPENFQKYILGYKKNGSPRAVYDVVKACVGKKKKKKGKKKDIPVTSIDFYTSVKKAKKKKKKKKAGKHWHI